MIQKTFLLLFLFPGIVKAQTIITDRPDQTESSTIVEAGSLQIESGFLLAYAEESELSIRKIQSPTVLFRIGITKWIELRVLSQYESFKNLKNNSEVRGISDLEIGAKVQLYKRENRKFEMAFLSHLRIPSGSNGLTINTFGTINKFAFSHTFDSRFGLAYNVGYNYFGYGIGIATYSIAISYQVSHKAAIYVEPYGDVIEFDSHFANIDAGFTYLLKDNMQLDYSFGVGINYTMNYMSIGFSWNISKGNEL